MNALPRVQGVTILANSHCAHCCHAVDLMTDWAAAEGVAVSGVDLWAHPEVAEWVEAEGSPTLVLDTAEQRVVVGMPTHEEFLRLVRG